MSEMTPAEFEGRLAAQREMIANLAALIAAHGAAEEVWSLLEESGRFQNHQEDPGAVPSAAFAVEGARGLEARALLEAAKACHERLVDKRKARPGDRAFDRSYAAGRAYTSSKRSFSFAVSRRIAPSSLSAGSASSLSW